MSDEVAAAAGDDRVDEGVTTGAGDGADGAGGSSGEIEYDCSPWAQETRRVLRSLLEEAGVPHAWEGTVLVVPAALEDRVDDLVEGALSTARPSLGSARETVAYGVSVYSAASQNRLVDALVEAGIPHGWDGDGDLQVHEEDAEALEELIDALGEPDGGDELDGLELHERLGELFVAVDRLVRDPHDTKASRGVVSTYEGLAGAAVPFGVDTAQWLELHRGAEALERALEGDDEGDDDGAIEYPGGVHDGGVHDGGAHADGPDPDVPDVDPVARHAAALRDLLRRFV